MSTIFVRRKTKSGKTIGYRTPDKGEPGRTLEDEKWFDPKVAIGWRKNQSPEQRIKVALKNRNNRPLPAARALMALANVTADPPTERKARFDALRLYGIHRRAKKRGLLTPSGRLRKRSRLI